MNLFFKNNVKKIGYDPFYVNYFMEDNKKYGDEHASLFKAYLDKCSLYKKDGSIDFTNDADFDMAKSVIEDFYSNDKVGMEELNYLFNITLFNLRKKYLDAHPDFDASKLLRSNFLGMLYDIANYYPINTESTILEAVYELESNRTEKLLDNKHFDLGFMYPYANMTPFCSAFSLAKTKEMALKLLEDDRFNKKNVIDTMNLMINGRIGQIERYLDINDDSSDILLVSKEKASVMIEQLDALSSGYGEILSSTIVDLCEGDPKLFDDIQKIVFDKGPGYYPEIYQDLRVSREEVIENSGKVLRKIFDN